MGMLRDMNVSVGGRRDSTSPQVGVLANEIPTGFPLPAMLANDIDSGLPNRLYSVEILGLPTAGTLFVGKAGEVAFTGAPDGVYSGPQRIRKFDPGVGLVTTEDTTYSFTIGSGTVTPPAGSGLATTVTFSVVDAATGAAVTGLTNLDFAFFDQPRIKDALAPVKKGATLAISGGTATIDITGVTSLAPGQTGRVEWGTADGTKAGGGQVVVS